MQLLSFYRTVLTSLTSNLNHNTTLVITFRSNFFTHFSLSMMSGLHKYRTHTPSPSYFIFIQRNPFISLSELGNQSIKKRMSVCHCRRLKCVYVRECALSPGANQIPWASPLMLNDMERNINLTSGRMCETARSGTGNESLHLNSQQSACQSDPVE